MSNINGRTQNEPMFEFRFFEIYRSAEYIELLLNGILVSGMLSVVAGIMGFLIASVLAIIRYWQIPIISFFCAAYIDFIRNTPLIVQLFFVAFGLPALFGYVWPFWAHALLGLTINFSGYFAEILRSGFSSIVIGQIEAAAALGLSRWQTFKKVVFPQTIQKMYAAISSQFIFIFLTTGVISEIGVEDLTHAGLFIDSRTFRSFEVFILLTIIYLAMSIIFKLALQLLYKFKISRSQL